MVLPLILFAVAAVGGLVLASIRLKGKNPPMAIALVHGAVAAAGLVTLGLVALEGGTSGAITASLILFAVAAAGGFVLFAKHLQGKIFPVSVMLVHAAVAVIAFVLLLTAVI